ncbi:hypothetical protein GQ457_06G006880 [Hibiscus cannabinus]
MIIKVDLAKAFDRLRWDFIEDTLLDARFPPNIIRIILQCITTSFQIQWNGILSQSFQPQRGIRQGDPLSPYRFNLTMEHLGQSIELSPLHLWSSSVAAGSDNAPLSHFVLNNGSWNWRAIRKHVDPVAWPFIRAICLPSSALGHDSCFWIDSNKRKFSVKNAYNSISRTDRPLEDFVRARRALTSDSSCSLCGVEEESLMHIILDCPDIHNLWMSLSVQSAHRRFFTMSLRGWTLHVCTGQGSTTCLDISPFYPILHLLPILNGPPSPNGWFSLNSDASLSHSSSAGSIGSVAWDHSKVLLFIYSKLIGTTTVLHVELWGILVGLQIARDKGCIRIQVQSDSADAINLLSPPSMLSPFSLVRSIAILCAGDCDIVFSTIPREANMVVDVVSKLDSSSSIAIYDSVLLTPGLRDLLRRDSFSSPYVVVYA